MNLAHATADRLVSYATALAGSVLGVVRSPRLSILIFHRVHAQVDALYPDEPDVARFERIVRYVALGFRVMRLDEAISRLASGTLPSRSMVITFDDGYADNAELALPILRRAGLPATFFVSTGFLDGGRMWIDTIIECMRTCPLDQIDLDAFGLGTFALGTLEERRLAIHHLLTHVKYLGLRDREQALRDLIRIARPDRLPSKLMMRGDQVRVLHDCGMEIGAHTVHHPILTTLTHDEARREIGAGKSALESIIQSAVRTLAYPNGRPVQDYDSSHVKLARSLGFLGAVSTSPGAARTGDDLFQLPRFSPWNPSMTAWAVSLITNQFRHTINTV